MSESFRSSRRELLRMGAGVLGATALGARDLMAQTGPGNTRLTGLLNQLGQQAQWRSPELRLARRITQGLTEFEATRARTLGYQAYLEEQLNPASIDDSAMDARVQRGYSALLALTPRQLMDLDDRGDLQYSAVVPMRMLVSERAVFSRRQLQERLFEFWSDHMYVPIWSFRGMTSIHLEKVIRPNMLGTVGALVRAGMRSTSMLVYLDQVWSSRFGVNENYARELMELHTVGWDGGYTQADVAGLARVLTGWSMDADGNFMYNANNHDFGAKQVFGMSFAARPQATSGTSGLDEGVAFGEMLIRHSHTKRFIATKLLRWFVSPDPSEAQIQAVVNAYGEEGDIKAMLRVVLSPANITRAPAKLKRPFHYAISTLRATGATINPVADIRRDFITLYQPIQSMGHAFGDWPTPDGYPDRADFWAGLIIDRFNAVSSHLVQTSNNSPGRAVFDVASFSGNGTVDDVVGTIRRRIFGGEMSAELETEIRFTLRNGVTTARVLSAVQLAVCAPEFHFY